MATGATPGRTSAPPSGSRTLTMSPSASTSGCPGPRGRARHVRRPARSTSTPARSASIRASGEAFTPAAQMTVRVGMRSVALVGARCTVTLSSSTPTTDSPSRPVTPRLSSERSALADRLSREGRQDAVERLDEQDARRRCGSKSRKSPRMSRAISAIWPAISTPVGPAPTTTKVSSAAWRSGSGSSSAASKASRICAADRQRALERLELGRVLLPLVVAEVGVLRAAGDDQRVVLERARARRPARRRAGATRRAARSKSTTSASTTRTLRRAAEDAPQRVADLGRRDGARGHLIGQRLEEVEVAPVDERDLDRQARELSAACRPPKPPPTTTTRCGRALGAAAPCRRSCRMRARGYFSTRARQGVRRLREDQPRRAEDLGAVAQRAGRDAHRARRGRHAVALDRRPHRVEEHRARPAPGRRRRRRARG